MSAWIATGADASRLPPQLRQLVTLVQSAQALSLNLKNTMAQMFADDATYAELATAFGVASANGQAVHDIVGSAATDLQSTNLLALVSRLG